MFVDLEEAYDRGPREELWFCMKDPGVAEKFVPLVQDMYESRMTGVRCVLGVMDGLKVEVGLH